ncbi:tetratricopeptide repeat protein [Novipirellula artificiosorum]|uniref:Tetratricopeptide repeat protein n=1 Tax=Novipirellula artificiosorum TaxID=2528016 RepID=A0A5C6DI69_9BACT|nr:tetratricopeptide repeat protein [Novipirellula artificiosorum]TWU35885.1 tetratricopeptide repeat protein [Novipirellula artificiosorum]
MNVSAPNQRRHPISVPKKVLFAAVVTIAFFIVLEGALALLGVRPTSETKDPFVGFSNKMSLFESFTDERGQTQMQTRQNKLIWFNDQRFLKTKPAKTRRLFCVGGSTTYGRPYDDATSFSGWLRELLPVADPSTQWEVINAGGISYASYRVAAVMEELAQYEPDLFVVYCGHNEFLERRTYQEMFEHSGFLIDAASVLSKTRTWTLFDRAIHGNREVPATVLPGEVDERLNHTIGPSDYHRDDRWQQDILHHFRFNLRRMVSIARRVGAEVVFVVPASNEKDCSPFKSEMSSDVTLADRKLLDDLYQSALSKAADGSLSEAIVMLEQAQQVDQRVALVDYQLGRLEFEQGEVSKARASFQQAINEDICPLRATESIVEAVRSFSQNNDMVCVDFDQRLRSWCNTEHGHSLLGQEYFLDHVHPTIQAHRHLALWLIETMQNSEIISGKSMSQQQIDAVSERVESQIDLTKQGVAMRNLAKVLHWAGKFDEAEPRAQDAIELLGGDAESQLILADCYRNTYRIEESVEEYKRLLDANPLYARGCLQYGDLLLELQQYEMAHDFLAVAAIGFPIGSRHHFRAQHSLGTSYLKLSDFDHAMPILESCLRERPNDPNVLFDAAQCKAGLGDSASAMTLYRRVLDLEPNDIETQINLGYLLLENKQPREAIPYFEAAIKASPQNPRAAAGLSVCRQLIDR